MAIIYKHCGQTLFRDLKPQVFTCQSCGAEYEIFSDEISLKNHRCNSCGARIIEVALLKNEAYKDLMQYARSLGASEARMFGVERIRIDENFRSLCEKPRCRNFGKTINCPPHSMMPQKFKEYLNSFMYVLAFKFEFPLDMLVGAERLIKLRLLHDTAVNIENHAKSIGFERARGFSGGSCFRTYCSEFDDCAALEKNGECRFPDKARPSLSGFGVNWHELSKTLGWQMLKDQDGNPNPKSETVMISGLVLVE
jgi:predicted metal-binding protein/DNA-directed RNA polymerase subunit RPC12/RpoP